MANVALNAYQEFLELKIVTRDYETSHVVPSWCVREVWKTHAVCDPNDYEEGCKGLCGKVIKYQVKKEPHEAEYSEMFTVKVYKIRFNRGLPKPIWSFKFDPNWKNEYQTEKDLKYSKRVENKEEETAIVSTSIKTSTFYTSNKNSLVANRGIDRNNENNENEANGNSPGNEASLNTTNNSQQLVPSGNEQQHSINEQDSTPQQTNNRRSLRQKRTTPSRNPIMTRARTKMLRLDPS